MSDMISRAAASSEFADWYGFNYQSQSYYKWLKSASTVNPITCDTLEYLETTYTGARACDDVAEQVRLARAIAAYKQDVHEDCTVLDAINKTNETYCTECHYFTNVPYEGEQWFGARCKKDGHSTMPSMYAIKSLHNDCPLVTEIEPHERSKK